MLLSVVLFYHIFVSARKPPSEFLEKVLPSAKLLSITGTVMTRTPLEWTRVMEKSMESTLGAHASQPAWHCDRRGRQDVCAPRFGLHALFYGIYLWAT